MGRVTIWRIFRSRHSWLCWGGAAWICWVAFLIPRVPWNSEPYEQAMKIIAVVAGALFPGFGALLDATLERYEKIGTRR